MTTDSPPLITVDVNTDGLRYELGTDNGMLWFRLFDVTGDDALGYFSSDGLARLRDDLSRLLVASGRTTVQLNADTLIGALRHTLALCDEMKKQSSAEVARIYQFVIAHVRSSCPEAMRAAMEGM